MLYGPQTVVNRCRSARLEARFRIKGGSVKVNAMGGKVMIDGANVVTADIAASNGVIHVIDTVLMPK